MAGPAIYNPHCPTEMLAWVAEMAAKYGPQVAVARARGEQVWMVDGAAFTFRGYEISSITDWLFALPTSNPRMVGKLHKLTWAQAVDHATRWHARLAKINAAKALLTGDANAFEVVR